MRNRFWVILLGLPIAISAEKNLTIAFTGNILSQIESAVNLVEDAEYGGAARLSTAIKNLRQSSDRFVLLDSGNHFAGYTYSYFGGKQEIELMNYDHYDAMGIGPYDLSLGEDVFDNWAHTAQFPLICSNLISMPQEKISRHIVPYMTIDRGGIIVGVFSLIPADAPFEFRVPPYINFSPEIKDIAREIIDVLEKQCDIIILLSQLRYDTNLDLAGEFDGIDVIIYNAGEQQLNDIIEVASEGTSEKTFIAGAGEKFDLGVINLTLGENGGIDSCGGNPIRLDSSVPPDAYAFEKVQSYTSRIPPARVIGETTTELDGRRSILLGYESNLGNLVANAVLWKYSDTDAVLIPGGSLYGDRIIPPGAITDRRIRELLPYDERVVELNITGNQLRAILERSVCCIGERYAGFFQVTGVNIEINFGQGSGFKTGVSSLSRVTVSGEPIDPEAVYNIITTDFVETGGYDYNLKGNGKTRLKDPLADIVIEYITENSPVAPKYDGRILLRE